MSRAVVFANGCLPEPGLARRLIRPVDVLIAADGGARHALALGLRPSLVVGDFDSLDEAEVSALETSGCQVVRHPADKDETDLELALQLALQGGAEQILVVGGLGGRLDQTLGNLALLTAPALASLDVRMDDGLEEAFFIRQAGTLQGQPGDLVSLIPWGGAVEGVRTQGLRWSLQDETLLAHKSRGISNRMEGESARVNLTSGLLLIVHRRQMEKA